jgi:hypothetical protein
MHQIKLFFRPRFILLAAVLSFLFLPVTKQTAFAEYCGTGFVQTFYDYSYTTVVGRCNRDCTGYTRCTGQKTPYCTVSYFECCS